MCRQELGLHRRIDCWYLGTDIPTQIAEKACTAGYRLANTKVVTGTTGCDSPAGCGPCSNEISSVNQHSFTVLVVRTSSCCLHQLSLWLACRLLMAKVRRWMPYTSLSPYCCMYGTNASQKPSMLVPAAKMPSAIKLSTKACLLHK